MHSLKIRNTDNHYSEIKLDDKIVKGVISWKLEHYQGDLAKLSLELYIVKADVNQEVEEVK